MADLPPLPTPPPPAPSIESLLEAKASVLQELGLFSYFTPPSYFRWALESIHMHLDIPWWATLCVTTLALRLLLIKVVTLSQKNIAIQSRYRKELKEFGDRMQEAKGENNNMLGKFFRFFLNLGFSPKFFYSKHF